ncbi:MAG: exosortase/archaeosortase family protein, partial [Vicinamibacteria bacterium]
PLVEGQASLAFALFGSPRSRIDVTLACSGADAVALCAGAILAYPALWRLRIAGAVAGTSMILALNTLRIGTLGRASSSPFWFEALHVYVWPGVLAVAIAGYVYSWMRLANRSPSPEDESPRPPSALAPSPASPGAPLRRFLVLCATFVLIFVAAAPAYLESGTVLEVASFIAKAAAAILGLLGLAATSTGNVLSTARGSFLVTQECIVTPVIPVYLAAVFIYAGKGPMRLLGLLAAIPLFMALGIVRLLVVALPEALIASPLGAIHAFYQWLAALVVVLIAARWRHGSALLAWPRAIVGALLGWAFVLLLGASYTSFLLAGPMAQALRNDPQGALAILPAFQVGLYLALAMAAFEALPWPRLLAGLGVLAALQMALFMVVPRFPPHVRDVRAWALLAPVLVCILMERWPSLSQVTRETRGGRPSSGLTHEPHSL